jgi:ATP-binding cassette, subfamily B, bacterial MsbA
MFGAKFKAKLADRNSAVALIHRLLTEQALGQWKRYITAFVLMAVASGATALSAYLVGNVINAAYVDKNLPGIIVFAVITALLFIVRAIATYGHSVILSRIGNHIIAQNQRLMFNALIDQNLAFFAQRHSSEFMSRLTTGAAAATQVINLLVTAVGRDLLSLIGLLIVMIAQDPLMSILAFIAVPPALVLLRKLIRRIYTIARNQFHGGTRILETMQETVQGIRTVKAYALEEVMRARLDANVASLEAESNKYARVANRASPLMDALGGITVALALVYGGYRVLQTGATPGQFFSFLAAFMLAYEPAKRLARLNIELNSGLVGVRILFEIVDAPPTEPHDEAAPPLQISSARVAFNDVRFSYRPSEIVIRNMTFNAEPGKMTALVGPSGGGKSTVFNLLLRFYDPDSGVIRIDGQNIADVSRHSLRSQIAYVGQDVFLFHGSIRENIAVGKPGASEAEIIAAAKAAHAHEFVSAFPSGYDTAVGERGTQLSGGERQRIAIARALIKNSHIILLDEATASLDSESERLVQDAMAHLCEGRTTIAIAHRLHTITHADRILVVEGGAIVESGRHDELLRKGGRYAAFYRLQIKDDQFAAPPIAVASA